MAAATPWVLLDNHVDLYFDKEDEESAAAAEAVASKCKSLIKAAASKYKSLPFSLIQDETTIALLGTMKVDLYLPEPPQIATLKLVGSKTHLKHDVGTTAYVACADKSLLVLYGGKFRGPGTSKRGCYVIIDAAADPTLVSTVPQVPGALYLHGIGAGTVVQLLRRRQQQQTPSYLLAELVIAPSRDLPDAELYLWRSDDQHPPMPPPQWARKEVRLPREVCWESCMHPFTADTSFYFSGPPGTTTDTFCWVDLLRGIVLCSNPAADQDDDDPLVFSFVRLPDECPAFDMLTHPDRPHMKEFRSVAFVGGAIKLVALLGLLEGSNPDQYRLTTWTLSPDLKAWRQDGSFLMDDLWATDEYCRLSVPPCAPICPVLSLSAPEVVYAVVNHLDAREIRRGSVVVETEPDFKCQYVLGLDICSNKIISIGSRLQPDMMELRPNLRATDFCASMQGKKDNRHLLRGRWKQALMRMERRRLD